MFTLEFPTGYRKDLLASVSERMARAFARSESAVLNNTVSVWQDDEYLTAYCQGEELLTHTQHISD